MSFCKTRVSILTNQRRGQNVSQLYSGSENMVIDKEIVLSGAVLKQNVIAVYV